MSADPPGLSPARPEVSVLICTRNRPRPLLDCLAALRVAAAACPELAIEVLVIENGSDAAHRLDRATVEAAGPPGTRLLHLPGGGLSRARNAGMAAARGTVLAFVDDDCLVSAGWLAEIRAHASRLPADFLLGGRVRLADPRDLPFTIKDVDRAEVFDRSVHPGGFIHGCNFCLPRRTAERLGGFDERFGAGGRFQAGEDTDYILRAHAAGVPVHYVPDMMVLHRHGRRTFAELDRLNRSYAHSNGALLAKHLLLHPWLLRHLVWTLRSTARERIGGPRFDEAVGLTWRSVIGAQLKGIVAFIGAGFWTGRVL